MTTRVPSGKPRGRPKGSQKVGGRVVGSLDRQARSLVTSEVAGHILEVYHRLGGVDFLERWSKKNETAFINSCLSRLMPPMPKDGEADVVNNTINVNGLSELEAARRVAFALAKAAYQLQDQEPAPAIEADITPQWRPPTDAPDMVPEFEDRPLFQPERGEPVTRSIETLGGGAGEQGRTVSRPTAQPKRTAAELCRSLSRRGRDLM